MAVSKLRKKGMVIDKKTGRKRRVDLKRSRAAKKAARKRHGKHLKAATKMKISKGVRKADKSHRTKTGRRLLKKVKHTTSKPYVARSGKTKPKCMAEVSTFRDRGDSKPKKGLSLTKVMLKKSRKRF